MITGVTSAQNQNDVLALTKYINIREKYPFLSR